VDIVEIVNAGTSAVNLANCRVRVYSDSSTSNPASIMLSGTLNPGNVYVLCGNGLGSINCNQTNGQLMLSGNDPISVECTISSINTTLDVIGQIGGSPAGGQWGDASLGTSNQSIQRNCSVIVGDTNGSDAFTPSAQWNGTGAVVMSGLGSRGCASTLSVSPESSSANATLWDRFSAWLRALLR
jgi:hypothetical protein